MAQNGTLKFYSGDRGYGFISPDNGQPDLFVHISEVERAGLTSLQPGDRLAFDTKPGRNGKGPVCIGLMLIE